MAEMPELPGSARIQVRIHSVKKNTRITVRILGPYIGAFFHYVGGEYAPCQGPGACQPGHHKKKRTWKGFCSAEIWVDERDHWYPIVLEITENLEPSMRDRELRGSAWVLTRPAGENEVGKVMGFCAKHYDPRECTPEFDVIPVLKRCYAGQNLILGDKNPMAEKIMLEPSPGERPDFLEIVDRSPPELAEPGIIRSFAEAFQKNAKKLRKEKNDGNSEAQ